MESAAEVRQQELWLKFAQRNASEVESVKHCPRLGSSDEQDTDFPEDPDEAGQDLSDLMSGASPHEAAWRAQVEVLTTRLVALDAERSSLQRQLEEERRRAEVFAEQQRASEAFQMPHKPTVSGWRLSTSQSSGALGSTRSTQGTRTSSESMSGSMQRTEAFRLNSSHDEPHQGGPGDAETDCLRSELAEHRTRLAALQVEAERLSQQRDGLAEESQRLREDCQVQRSQAAARDAECDSLRKAINEMKLAVEAEELAPAQRSRRALVDLEMRLTEAEARGAECDRLRTTVQQLKLVEEQRIAEHDVLQAAVTDLEMQLGEAEGLRATVRRLEVELSQERTRVKEQTAEMEQLRLRMATLVAERQTLQSELGELRCRNQQSDGELIEKGALEMLQEEYRSVVEKVEMLRQEAEVLRAECADLGACKRDAYLQVEERRALEDELGEERSLANRHLREVEKLQTENSRLTKLCHALADTSAKLVDTERQGEPENTFPVTSANPEAACTGQPAFDQEVEGTPKSHSPAACASPLTKAETERLIVDHATLAQERWVLAADAEAQRQRADVSMAECLSLKRELEQMKETVSSLSKAPTSSHREEALAFQVELLKAEATTMELAGHTAEKRAQELQQLGDLSAQERHTAVWQAAQLLVRNNALETERQQLLKRVMQLEAEEAQQQSAEGKSLETKDAMVLAKPDSTGEEPKDIDRDLSLLWARRFQGASSASAPSPADASRRAAAGNPITNTPAFPSTSEGARTASPQLWTAQECRTASPPRTASPLQVERTVQESGAMRKLVFPAAQDGLRTPQEAAAASPHTPLHTATFGARSAIASTDVPGTAKPVVMAPSPALSQSQRTAALGVDAKVCANIPVTACQGVLPGEGYGSQPKPAVASRTGSVALPVSTRSRGSETGSQARPPGVAPKAGSARLPPGPVEPGPQTAEPGMPRSPLMATRPLAGSSCSIEPGGANSESMRNLASSTRAGLSRASAGATSRESSTECSSSIVDGLRRLDPSRVVQGARPARGPSPQMSTPQAQQRSQLHVGVQQSASPLPQRRFQQSASRPLQPQQVPQAVPPAARPSAAVSPASTLLVTRAVPPVASAPRATVGRPVAPLGLRH